MSSKQFVEKCFENLARKFAIGMALHERLPNLNLRDWEKTGGNVVGAPPCVIYSHKRLKDVYFTAKYTEGRYPSKEGSVVVCLVIYHSVVLSVDLSVWDAPTEPRVAIPIQAVQEVSAADDWARICSNHELSKAYLCLRGPIKEYARY